MNPNLTNLSHNLYVGNCVLKCSVNYFLFFPVAIPGVYREERNVFREKGQCLIFNKYN